MPYMDYLKKVPPFNYLSEDELEILLPQLRRVTYPKGSYVFRQKDPSQHTLFLIIEGLAEVIVTNEQGVENVVGLRKQYEFFGETVVLTDNPYPASVKVVEELDCIILSRNTFEFLLEKSIHFAGFFSRILSERLRVLLKESVLEQSYQSSGIGSQPFRKRVANIMSSPVITCYSKDDISTIAGIMASREVSSLVVIDDQEKPVGLITETDLVTKVLAINPFTHDPKTIKAADIMNSKLAILTPDAYFSEALLAMVKESYKHVIVAENERLIGIVTMRDLVKSRSTGALTIISRLESQTTIIGLSEASKEVIHVLQALISEKASVPEILEVMTQFYDRITRKVIEIAEEEMLREGYGKPPVEYCWLTMGSGGRKEQFLQTDQDNAIIYGECSVELEPAVRNYFSIFAIKVVEGLFQCGFAKCKGNIMASNDSWCRSIKGWKRLFTQWTSDLNPDNIRMLTIFLDFRSVYGKHSLADSLRQYIIKSFKAIPLISHQLTKDDLEHKVPLGLFNQFIVEKKGPHKNEIDLKGAVCIHIVDCIRVFALREGIMETNTLFRLKEITDKGILPQDDAEFIDAAYQSLMMFRIRENLKKIIQNKEPDNYINPYKLSKRDRAILKEAFLAASRLQSYTGSTFRVDEFGGF